ncbi:hypothetical protein SAY86_019706 [Trapa natans]|uniref:Uncharacterized protein n=1 Tax=Trapa natans TaxID=22666 RepID=A0AAN7R3H9_TRANT|nr:hypothetical protein SAY86_019706 [Trapa natans]
MLLLVSCFRSQPAGSTLPTSSQPSMGSFWQGLGGVDLFDSYSKHSFWSTYLSLICYFIFHLPTLSSEKNGIFDLRRWLWLTLSAWALLLSLSLPLLLLLHPHMTYIARRRTNIAG